MKVGNDSLDNAVKIEMISSILSPKTASPLHKDIFSGEH